MNYSALKAAIAQVVRPNDNQEITGENLRGVFNALVNSIAQGYLFAGVATPSTEPGTPDQNVVYLAGAGSYSNFGDSITVNSGCLGIFAFNGEWTKDIVQIGGSIQGIPSVDIAQLNSLGTSTDQAYINPSVYTVTTLHNLSSTVIKVGTLFIFSDAGRTVVTQILLSNYQVDGGGNISSPNASKITMYYRMYNVAQSTWSAWTLYGGSGGGGTIDQYPTSGSDNPVASNGVFEGLQKAAPEININDLDDLGNLVDMRTGEASVYTLKYMHTQSSTWLRIGVVMCFANHAQNTLTQIVVSNCVVDGGGNLIPNYATNVMNIYYRFKQFSGNPPEGMTIGVWSAWTKFEGGGNSGYLPDNEDIDLNASDQLQFANKLYDTSVFSGLGRMYLRKNIVELNLTNKYFDGFVSDVLVQNVGASSTPDAICFDTTRKMFVARVGLSWYLDWSSDEDYNPITNDVNWNYNGNFYRWNGEELAQWDKTINQLTQAMVNTANTIYHIQYDYDLNGQTITMPAGCVLEFDGGSLANGTIIGTNTTIDGKPLFKGITFDGSYVCKHVSTKDFKYATDDDGLTAVFQLLNCIKNDVVCELEAKTYNIDYKSSVSGNNLFSKWKLDNCSNITINGNGAVLNHTNPLTDIPYGSAQLNSILKLNSCTYITIKELTYQNLNGYETNYQGDCDGICVIFFEGDNRFLDISMTAKNARSALGNHIYAPAQTNHIGLVSNSVFNVKQYHTGYGVNFSWIANSKINVESHGQHRGVYLTGASNCNVYLEWEDQWIAPIACLLGNSWTGGSDNLVWHTCRDLNIVSICTQETANANDATVTKYCAGLGSSEEPRTIGLTMQNITITTGSLHGLNSGFIAVLSTSPSTDTTVKDYYKNFTFTINNIYSRFEFHDNRVIQDFTIVNSRFSGGIYANFINSSKLIFLDSYLNSARIGKGTYYFINTDIAELMDYNGGSSKANTLICFDNCFITSTSNLTIKATIISSMLPYKQQYFWPFSVLYSGTNCDVSRVMIPNYRANALNYGKLLIQTSNNGGSANRPSNAENLKVGVMYFDTTLKKPIWWNSTEWVDAAGVPAANSLKVLSISQTDYDALVTKDANTLYVIS